MRIRKPKRIRLGLRQKPHGEPRRWIPSWVKADQPTRRPSLLDVVNFAMKWTYGGQCGTPRGQHGLPCACVPLERTRIANMVSRSNALLEILRQ